MNSSAAGAVLGLLAAVGFTLLVSRLLALRPPSMLERIAPFVPATAQMRARVRRAPGMGQVCVALMRPMLELRVTGASLEQRLNRAGVPSVDRFRIDQSGAVGVGAVAGAVMGFICAVRGASPICLPLFIISGAIAGFILADRRLAQRIRSRQEQISRELPAVAELLAFAAAAGESPAAAVERVSRTLAGELSAELQRSLGAVRGGQALDLALRDMVDRVGSPEVERFIDAFVIAIERGSPLADVLRAQASDVRAAERRALMERAGRKEVAMLIPVVFLILPTVVLIAVFPGVQGLQLVVRS